MRAKIHVIDKETFDTWYKSDKKTPFDQESVATTKHPGLELLESNGCLGCHSVDGSILVGPSYKDMFGHKVKVSVNGTLKEVIADEAYLKRAILEPDSEVVDGFSAGMMSSYKDVLTEKQIDDIIDYFKNGQNTPKEDIGAKATSILESNGCLGCHSVDGSILVGPSYKDMFGHKVKVSVNGTLKEVIADDAYLKRAILEPDSEVVDGFSAGMMSSYKGILSDSDIDIVIEYFKGL
jgi:cytochrome c oxidase subunit 2